ncbi:hypothetical protein [Rhodohalobacter sp. 8-1]|uniref:hypothetical protein n=1 Tax=Rhodohalobacter sp. 8-1 TaxID=3131972 RepID=UPI0030EF1616
MDSKTLEILSVEEDTLNESIQTGEDYTSEEATHNIYSEKITDYEEKDTTIDDTQTHSENESTSEKDLFTKSGQSYKNLSVFESIQKWKGHVTKVKDESFEARLIDLTNGGADEFAEFSIFDISENERESLEIGKIFYWSIGRKEYLGQIEKSSRIRFQKVIKWDLSLVNKVNSKVAEYLKAPEAN